MVKLLMRLNLSSPYQNASARTVALPLCCRCPDRPAQDYQPPMPSEPAATALALTPEDAITTEAPPHPEGISI